jgi:hypothetical protein
MQTITATPELIFNPWQTKPESTHKAECIVCKAKAILHSGRRAYWAGCHHIHGVEGVRGQVLVSFAGLPDSTERARHVG